MSKLDPAIAFYLDSAYIKHDIGFTYSDVIEFPNYELEKCHGYIQWLFPLKEPSAYIPNAPLVTQETLDDFLEFKTIVHDRMISAATRMIEFYFYCNDWDKWVTLYNHNFLRITRIIKSLKLFGYENNADIFYNILMRFIDTDPKYVKIIGPTTLQFWKEANEA